MNLPLTINDFGDSITIRRASADELPKGSLGQYKTETGEVLILEGQTETQEIIILVHEIIHLWEQQAIMWKMIKKDLPEVFIEGLAYGLTMMLTMTGVIPEVAGFQEMKPRRER